MSDESWCTHHQYRAEGLKVEGWLRWLPRPVPCPLSQILLTVGRSYGTRRGQQILGGPDGWRFGEENSESRDRPCTIDTH